jgi:carboxyl-terminal processing protease
MRILCFRLLFWGLLICSFCNGEQLLAQVGSSESSSSADLKRRAAEAYAAKQFAESVQLYAQAIALEDASQRADDEYNEACSLAQNGDKERALGVLAQAVEDGWGDRDHTAVDTDLVSLHGDPRFTALLAHMDTIKKAQDSRWGSAALKSPYATNLSDTEKVAGLSELWAQAKFGFANFWNVPGLDWDATYKSYLPQVLATKSTEEYYRVLSRFSALLHDGHSGVYEPDELRRYVAPLTARLVDGKVLVTGSLDPKFDMQGVNPGDEVLQVNGLPVKEYAEQNVLPYMTASSPQDREARTYGIFLFEGYAGTIFHVVTETPKGKQSKHDFAVPARFFSPDQPFEFHMLPGNVAYVALNEFDDNKDAEGWDSHWSEINKAKAVILDMRRNGGGSDDVGQHVLATLLDKPVALPRQESPEWIATYRAWGQAEPMQRYPVASLQPDTAHHFAGKVVMLTGPQTFSAAEDLVVVFATSKRGVIVGEATGGSTGQPLIFDLPGGGYGRICTKHDSFPDGHEFVGVGVPPDVAAHTTREDLIKGTDSVLDKGLKVALQP